LNRWAIAAAAAALLAGAGCGSEASGAGEQTELGPLRGGSVAALAQCSDWVHGTQDQKVATVQDIRDMVNQTGTAEPTTDLNDPDAVALLDRACSNDYASGFRLYKLYTRGAAFSSITGNPQP
jgi:hypothetical protein